MSGGLAASQPLVFNEGGARNDIWRRIITDVLGIPTALLRGKAGAPLGDAILAGVATGVCNDFGVASRWAATCDLMEPDPEAHEYYQRYFTVFRTAYRQLREDFSALAEIVRSEFRA
jgi:ribulokinase